ncbi:MAG TPA: hypothetical protein VMV69_02300 [Pirellulales bacterium]|nr:hypothetical protein [Pirellulales bacterium]
MKDEDRDTVHEIAWREVFPWLLLVRAFRVSIQLWQIVLGSLGLLCTISGWWVLTGLFAGSEERPLTDWRESYLSNPWQSQAESLEVGPAGILAGDAARPYREDWSRQAPSLGRFPSDPFLGPWRQLQASFGQLFDPELRITGLAFLLSCGLWTIAVWGVFGGALTRRAALRLGRDENVGVKDSLGYAISKWRSFVAAPLLPMIGVLICATPMFIVGLFMRSDAGVAVAGLIWPLMLIGGLCIAMLLLVLLFGWPLMWPTISTEGSDSFDALSRPWSYVFHRPLHYLFYAAVAAALGWLGWLFVAHFALWVAYLPKWAATWGAGHEQASRIFPELYSPLVGTETPALWGARLIAFWGGCARLVALGFVYSYFWTASTAIYLLLRRDEDGTEIDDVHLGGQPAHGLPVLEKDAAGVHVAPKNESVATPATAPMSEGDGDGSNPP